MTVHAPVSRPVQPSHTAQATAHGPVAFVVTLVLGLIPTTIVAWIVGLGIELVGMHTLWKEQGIQHARAMVVQDLGYIAAAPTSLLVDDTVSFAHEVLRRVGQPFVALGVVRYYESSHRTRDDAPPAGAASAAAAPRAAPFLATLRHLNQATARMLADIGMVAMYSAQETALRLAIAVFAMPAFVLACLLGAVDGMVRRDLRRWNGGRESSFVYHHAKALTWVALGGGFSLYLAWPFGNFNPAYMVVAFTAIVAWSLSLTVASFKKYL